MMNYINLTQMLKDVQKQHRLGKTVRKIETTQKIQRKSHVIRD